MIKQKLTEVGNYFKNKVIEGDFEVISMDNEIMVIEIDGYKFNLWIPNGEYFFKFYWLSGIGFEFPFKAEFNFTDEEKTAAWEVVQKTIEEQKETAKQQRIDELKRELEGLE